MAQIHVLDPHTAELIAAGEVVERPASVVKELVENSIDAGARHITVEIERGGISLIRVADDGSGIEAECIPTAFLRHATSKIAREEDLENIATLGFRGEALASIASVARVELLTRTPADEYACCYRISGGREEGLEPGARALGTTFTVRDLFFNTPARMKFLKKDQSEGNYVADVVSQLALSHPEVAVKFVREGKTQFQTPGDGKLLSASYAVLSREFSKDLLPVGHTAGNYSVSGLVTPPRACRASRSMQYFFINGRHVKNRTMMAALEAAYKGTLMQGKFPGCVLMLTMPPQLVDVNVHPAKTEVRFAREKDVFEAVYAAVKSVLSQPEASHREFSFAEEGRAGAPAQAPSAAQAQHTGPAAARPSPRPEQIRAYTDFVQSFAKRAETVPAQDADLVASQPSAYHAGGERVQPMAAATPKAPVPAQAAGPAKPAQPAPSLEGPAQPAPAPAGHDAPQAPAQMCFAGEEGNAPFCYVGEVFNTYLIAQRGDEMCLIDKHAAHERAIYEELAKAYGSVASQQLLCPVTVQLSAEEKDALLAAGEVLAASGLEVEDFGGRSVVVRAVPADIVPEDVEDLLLDVAQRLCANPKETVSGKTEWVLHSVACRAAVKGGEKNSRAQLIRLAQDVLDGKIPPYCPHGRPVVLKITLKELEKQFGRQG